MLKQVRDLIYRQILKYFPDSYQAQKIYLKWFREWHEITVYMRASTVNQKYQKFKYVFELNTATIFTQHYPFTLVGELYEMTYPHRSLGDNLVWSVERGIHANSDFYLNDIGGGDSVFAATNNENDALIIALKYQ